MLQSDFCTSYFIVSSQQHYEADIIIIFLVQISRHEAQSWLKFIHLVITC